MESLLQLFAIVTRLVDKVTDGILKLMFQYIEHNYAYCIRIFE